MKLVSMKLDPKEQKQEADLSYKAPSFPYGLCIELNDDSLDKLGIDKLPDVDDTMIMTARVTVSNTGANATADGESKRMSLQITEMSLGPDAKESDASDKLYTK